VEQPALTPAGEVRWELARVGGMRVPGAVFASEELLPHDDGGTLAQVANVATLPGIVRASFAMPDLHLGYGFPIGGVAATDVDDGGVVSPGGVGFDISCGIRVLAAPITLDEVTEAGLARLANRLGRAVPRGTGPGGRWTVGAGELERVLCHGAVQAVARGWGDEADLEVVEDGGRLPGADPAEVGDAARKRGAAQLGSLGGGNYFAEVQAVEEVLDAAAADAFGLAAGQLVAMIHTGSRGLGHQVCTDHVRAMSSAMRAARITVPDRQLACAPVDSPAGGAYLGAMAAAANYGRANRQVLGEAVREAFTDALGVDAVATVYDVSHNLAKLEDHALAAEPTAPHGDGGATPRGSARRLCVHRKGATRALAPGHLDLPAAYREVGQPAPVPGSMGTSSWLLAGRGGEAFASTCHGAGRARSRAQARKTWRAGTLQDELAAQGIRVRAASARGVAEEAPGAYKSADAVVEVCGRAGLSQRVARLRPVVVVKG
jgi:tRNA-splicing ligase RtcB